MILVIQMNLGEYFLRALAQPHSYASAAALALIQKRTRGKMAEPPAGTGVAGAGTDGGATAGSLAHGAAAPRQVILLPDDILKLIGTFVPDPPTLKWELTLIKQVRTPYLVDVIAGRLSISSNTQGVRVCQTTDTDAPETVTRVGGTELRRVLERVFLVGREHLNCGRIEMVSTALGVTVSCIVYKDGTEGANRLKFLLFSPLGAGEKLC